MSNRLLFTDYSIFTDKTESYLYRFGSVVLYVFRTFILLNATSHAKIFIVMMSPMEQHDVLVVSIVVLLQEALGSFLG